MKESIYNKRTGKGKEYNNKNKLIFEGEYIFGQRKRGKYFVNEHLEFEGEYLYNRKWNGKGYDINGNIIYELNNGKGFVKEYNIYNDKLLYEGEYLDGKRNGKGKEYNIYNGKLIYEGEFVNGKRKEI